MNKYVPFEKLSKKKQKELNAKRRGTWGNINPITRKPDNPKAYNRQKARRSSQQDYNTVPSVFVCDATQGERKETPCAAPDAARG